MPSTRLRTIGTRSNEKGKRGRVLAGVDVGLEFHARYLLSIQFV
jgi:hypothetical protein